MIRGSYRKPRPLNRKEEHVRDTSLIIIATEGEKREPLYFEMDVFRNNKKIQVKVISTTNGESSPTDVLSRLHEYASEYQFGEGDQFWLVIDKDRWSNKNLYEIKELCNDRNYRLALSNPCFELWLLLHFRKENELPLKGQMNCTDIKKLLNPQLNERDEGNYDATYARWVKHAIKEARCLDKHPGAPFPDCPGTRIYQLVEILIS